MFEKRKVVPIREEKTVSVEEIVGRCGEIIFTNCSPHTWGKEDVLRVCESLLEEGEYLLLVEDENTFHLVQDTLELHVLQICKMFSALVKINTEDPMCTHFLFGRILAAGKEVHTIDWEQVTMEPGTQVLILNQEDSELPAIEGCFTGVSNGDRGKTTRVARDNGGNRWYKESDGYAFYPTLPVESVRRQKSIFAEKRSRLN